MRRRRRILGSADEWEEHQGKTAGINSRTSPLSDARVYRVV